MFVKKYGAWAGSVIALVVFVFSVVKIVEYYSETRSSKQQINEARTLYENATTSPVTTPKTTQAAVDAAPSIPVTIASPTMPESLVQRTNATVKPPIQERFKPLLETNDDVVGWLKIEDTSIDYPVVQADDNAFYLKKDFHKTNNVTGSIFMDYRNRIDEAQKHWIIYGHYMKDEIMFKGLLKYKDEAYYREHPLITFDTLYGDRKWLIFSAYYTTVDDDYIRTDFKRNEQFASFAAQLKANSLYDTHISVDADDTILTLSTCSKTEEGGRFTVHAKLITDAY
ncbi:class B sortase [Cohnella yongneupensis]|uniref:Class B sortase n=1 Tax=Cohnella yongneupensis TaxID=425006 RepID=A0ABW0R133_9BACL